MPAPEVAGVVLAAGPGRRMGLPTPKLLLPIQGKSMLAWVLELVEGLPLGERVLVLGAQAPALLAALFPGQEVPPAFFRGGELRARRAGGAWRVLYNPDWPEGMGASLRCAARAVPGGMLVFLGDMPYVPLEAARAVLARAGAHPVAPAFRGQRGFPVYLPAALRPALLELRGDVGARNLLSACELLPWDHPGVVWDVDCPEEAKEGACAGGPSPR
ncbi:MAG: nucleotidyltransferase family protein [Candidatus Bipolaricaulota bacterium]|nr:nucleotidyltransferase family protein [Candidatus Bipolaricaulota bacterium]MDW8151453.1 nucleotidyltransferase family protein [Candidatus Bipolaricaulota bacterium]